MASKQDLAQSHLDVEEHRKALNAFWASALDEDGNFDWIFGDPSSTVWYDEEENVKVDVIFPATENAIIEADDGPTDRDLETLQDLAYETAHLLDKDVPAFAQGIYSFMESLLNHPSFTDPLWEQWKLSKQNSVKVAANYKLSVEKEATVAHAQHLKLMQEKRREKMEKYVAMENEREVMRIRDQMLQKQVLQHLATAKIQHHAILAAQAAEAEEEEIRARAAELASALFLDLPAISPTDPFVRYVASVASLESPFLLWSNYGLRTLHPVVGRLPWLQEVNLSNNRLDVLPPQLVSLPNLKRLFLHCNDLRVLPKLSRIPKLEVLDLHQNELSILPNDISSLKYLQMLDVEHNQIRILQPEIGDLASLQHLNLARNRIKIIPMALIELKKLTYLNLKLNPIVNLPPHIYIQGTAACMTYLREQTTDPSLIQSTALISDFSTLFQEDNKFLADLVLKPNDFSSASQLLPVHRILITARSNILANHLHSQQQLNTAIPTDPQLGLPILNVDLNFDQLSLLVTYLYTDTYKKPELILMPTSISMTEAQIVETVQNNQILTMAFSATLARAITTATTFGLPHLQYLIENVRKPTEAVESTFISDFKKVFNAEALTLPELAAPSAGNASKPANAKAISVQAEKIAPYDVSFVFSSHPYIAAIRAHRFVLCARSKFFRSLLTGGLAESQQEVVTLHDIEPNIFKNIIEFCYTDDVYELSGDTIMDLLTSARLYGLNRLLGIVESVIGYSLDLANVTSILSIAHMYSLPQLGKACKFFVLSNWDKVVKDPEWEKLEAPIREKLTRTAENWGIHK